jgi:hypothetical protein
MARLCEFPGFADCCPWPARATHRKSATWHGLDLSLPAINGRTLSQLIAVIDSCRNRRVPANNAAPQTRHRQVVCARKMQCPVRRISHHQLSNMHLTEFFAPGEYEVPLTASGRARTIAAFHVAEGDKQRLSQTEMRRDVLTILMSPSAVQYWLSRGWLEKTRKLGRIQLLRLTDKGAITCTNGLNGGGDYPTTPELVSLWRSRMKFGAPGFEKKSVPPLPVEHEGGP